MGDVCRKGNGSRGPMPLLTLLYYFKRDGDGLYLSICLRLSLNNTKTNFLQMKKIPVIELNPH